ncbi:hypothetical protein NQ318_003919 [Aromia moschata]|uniref:15-hydroxyprostaglandin dehydrogenase [NAD(+)]-like n=1 Tax=Aromia moschata TaxID=1265417 RepID=A0AAV8Z9H7_9CUCU|nr:hypothetical protein NQ318_003919 [Aromia moschata]
MVFDVKGKVALVTGGATGIGLATSMELLKNGLKGVVIADMDPSKGEAAVNQMIKEFGAKKAVFITTDVTQKDELEAAFRTTLSTFGSLDIVINNAGIMNDANWELQIAINCNAMVQGLLFGIKYMGTNNGGKGGVMVNVSSVMGLQQLEGSPVYAATQHFTIGLDRSFGTPYFYKKTGIKYLTMCPGITDTEMVSQAGKLTLEGFPDLGKVLLDELTSMGKQSVANVAKGMMLLITNGENGSMYVAEGNKPAYEIEIPNRATFRKH